MSDFIFSGNLRCTRDIYVGPNQKKPVMSINSNGDVTFGGTRGIRVPVGTTAERPFYDGPLNQLQDGIPTACRKLGYLRFNTETNKYEGYGVCHATGLGEWGDIGGVASGRFHVVDGGSQTTRVKVQSSLDKYGGTGLMFYTGVQGQNPDVRMNIDSTGNVGIGLAEKGSTGFPVTPCCALHVGGTDAVKIPSGTTAQRPATSSTAQHSGFIRYNTTTNQFEGYGAGNSWGSLGGVKDVDQDTFIRAETSANADNDELEFFAAGNKKMTISSSNILIDSTLQVTKQVEILQLSKTIIQSDGDVTINGTVKIGLDADAPTTLNDGIYLWNTGTSGSNVGRIGANSLGLHVGTGSGSEKISITSTGDVGIGTTNPQSKLDVNGSIRAGYNTSTISYFGKTAIGYPGYGDWAVFSHLNHTTGNNYCLSHCSNGTTYLNGTETSFQINGYTKMRLANNGNFGIGTTSPIQKLHLKDGGLTLENATLYSPITYSLVPNEIHGTYGNDSDTGFLRLSGGGEKVNSGGLNSRSWIDLIGYQSPTSATASYTKSILFGTAGNERMRINQNGNVGIGTTGPGYKLQIRSDISHSSVASTDPSSSGYSQVKIQSSSGGGNGARVGLCLGASHHENIGYIQTVEDGTAKRNLILQPHGQTWEALVGIGTTTPSSKLDVNGDIKVTKNGQQIILDGDHSYIRHRKNGVDRGYVGYPGASATRFDIYNGVGHIILNPESNNVGIGTAAPSDKLDVNGIVKATKFKVGTSTSTSYDSALSIGSYPANPWLVFSDNQWKTPIQLKQYYHHGGIQNNERDLPLPDGMTTQKDWFANVVAWWVDGFDIDEGTGGRSKARGVYVRFDDNTGKWKVRWGFSSENSNTDTIRSFRVTIMWIHKNLITFKGGSHTSAKDNTWGHYTQWTNSYGTENIP